MVELVDGIRSNQLESAWLFLIKLTLETYGTPVPTTVPFDCRTRSFHRCNWSRPSRLESILWKQTDGKGVNIYTHG